MPMRFAEINIIRNIKEESISRTISRYFGYENQTSDNDIIIIDFGDGILCNTKDEYVDLNFKFEQLGYQHGFPIYFKQKDEFKTLFYRNPIVNKGNLHLYYVDEIKNYIHNKGIKLEPSKYNLIYEDINKKEIFTILKICSNEKNPRFMLEYEDTMLNRDDIIYLTECIFKEKFT
jgi:hypothetical protein